MPAITQEVSKMKSERLKLNEKLRDAYNNLPLGLYVQVRDDLCNQCCWSIATFYSRVSGARVVRSIEIPIIKSVFEKYGVKVFD